MPHTEVGIMFNEKLNRRAKICQMMAVVDGLHKNGFFVLGLFLGLSRDGNKFRMTMYPCKDFDPIQSVFYTESLTAACTQLRGIVMLLEEKQDGWERDFHKVLLLQEAS